MKATEPATIDSVAVSKSLVALSRSRVIIRGILVEHRNDDPQPYCQTYVYTMAGPPYQQDESLVRLSYRTPLEWQASQAASPIYIRRDCSSGVGSTDYLHFETLEWDQFGHIGWISTQQVVFIRERKAPDGSYEVDTIPVNHPEVTRRLTLLEQRLIDSWQRNGPAFTTVLPELILPRLIGLNRERCEEYQRATSYFST